MKTRNMNSHSLHDIVRFGAVLIVALAGLVLLAEGAKSSRSYSLVFKPRTKPREIRGLRPQSLSTAIGFGKRDGSFRSSDLDGHNSIMLAPQEDTAQNLRKFPMFWFLQYLRNNPELVKKFERELLADGEDEDEEENNRSPGAHRYKKSGDNDDSYYSN